MKAGVGFSAKKMDVNTGKSIRGMEIIERRNCRLPRRRSFQVFGDSIFFFLSLKKRILEIYNGSCYPYSPFSSEDRENIQEICSVIRVRILPTLLPFEGISRARNNVCRNIGIDEREVADDSSRLCSKTA